MLLTSQVWIRYRVRIIIFFIDSIDYDQNQSQAFAKITSGPKEKNMSMKIDSGLQVNVIPKSIFHSLGTKWPFEKHEQTTYCI